ncbi:MAG: succinylglutamate desuccinylase/aspartoacylase family protein, partial [Rhodospirillales bacterium]|nr:succinylglutamate desuccinylase/aspartoacylase family protein [Rhodospirillales bacterium]
MTPEPPAPIGRFEVGLAAPDLGPWRQGNTGIAGFTTFAAAEPGPHVALLGLMHGNEIAGAIVLDRLLGAGFRPARGRLTFGFLNLAAFDRFDPRQPTLSRFVDEDLNRVWDGSVLDSGRRSAELDRAREIRPLIDTVDVLLDLHSMLWESDPLILCGMSPQGRALALGIGTPELIVADHGHTGGKRLIDYTRFAGPGAAAAANLVEAGRHWEPATVETTLASLAGLLHHLEMVPGSCLLSPPLRPPQRVAEVTQVVNATTTAFAFVQPWRGGEI